MNLTKIQKAIEQIDKEAKSKEQNRAWKIVKDALKVQELRL
jgi:hypothetical protein